MIDDTPPGYMASVVCDSEYMAVPIRDRCCQDLRISVITESEVTDTMDRRDMFIVPYYQNMCMTLSLMDILTKKGTVTKFIQIQ
jgi:hypothetical protein